VTSLKKKKERKNQDCTQGDVEFENLVKKKQQQHKLKWTTYRAMVLIFFSGRLIIDI
jgi:hypothetical protein